MHYDAQALAARWQCTLERVRKRRSKGLLSAPEIHSGVEVWTEAQVLEAEQRLREKFQKLKASAAPQSPRDDRVAGELERACIAAWNARGAPAVLDVLWRDGCQSTRPCEVPPEAVRRTVQRLKSIAEQAWSGG